MAKTKQYSSPIGPSKIITKNGVSTLYSPSGNQSLNPPTVKQYGGGGSKGSSNAAAQAAEAAANAEAARQKAAAEKLKNELQRQALLKQIESQRQAKIQAAKIKAMSVKERNAFYQNQANITRAATLQGIQDSGRRLTPAARKFVNRYLPPQSVAQPKFDLRELARQQDQYLQSTPKGVADLRTGKLIETTAEQKLNRKFEITKKLEDFLSKRGLLNKEKYSAWEKNALKEVDKYQNTRGYKNARQFWLDAAVTSNDLFIGLPTALVNLSIVTGKGGIKAARNPRQTASYFAKELRSAQNLVSGFAKNKWKKYGSPEKAFNAIIKAYAKKKNLEIGLQKLIIRTIVNNKNAPKTILKKLKNLKVSDITGGAAIASGTIRKTASLSYYKIRTLPANLTELVNKPRNILSLPKNLILDTVESVKLLRTSPSEGIAKIGSDYLTFKVAGGSIKVTGKVAKDLAVKLNPKFVGVAEVGAELKLKGVKGDVTLDVVGKIPKESIKKQIARAGTKTTAISSQADSLLGLFKRSKGIKKPLGEAVEGKIGKKATRLLKKLDNGKSLTNKEISYLNKAVRRAKSKGLLERSFFADPTGKIRPSRLGIAEKEASLKEFLSGKATLKKSKPQILLFENIKIQKFPKALQGIVKKIKAGKKLTETEGTKLLKFQLKKSGKFKPLGFATKEAELTLSPGEIIKRVKKVAKVKIKGKYVDIISTKVVKPSKITRNLIKKARTGKATTKELKSLARKLKKETGLDYSTSLLKNTKKYFPLGRKASALALSKLSSKKKKIKTKTYSPNKVKYSTSGKPYVLSSGKRKFISPSSIKSPVTPSPTSKYSPIKRRTPISRGKSGSSYGVSKGKKTVSKKIRRRKSILTRKAPKRKNGYDVYARPLKKKGQKKQPKLIKVNRVPLTKKRAEDLRNYILDTSLARTGSIKKAIGKPQNPKLKVPLNYERLTRKKFRTFKQRRGKRIKLNKNKVIERSKFLLDRKEERKKISLSKRIAQLNKPRRRGGSAISLLRQRRKVIRTAPRRKIMNIRLIPRRRLSSAQRKTRLNNLAKARKVLRQKRKTPSRVIRKPITRTPIRKIKRSPVKRIIKRKTKATPAQLRALKKARAALRRKRK